MYLSRWAHDPIFLASDFTNVMITENLADLNKTLIQNPYTTEIKITIPGKIDRLNFINFETKGDDFAKISDVTPEIVHKQTAGLNYVNIRSVLSNTRENDEKISFESLSKNKKELIEAEAYGLLEFVETEYSLDNVAGHTHVKKHLRQAVKALQEGRQDVMPMGYLVCGPWGTGKTFLVTCFASEVGIPMVKAEEL